jgi:hypothetical protein
VEICLLVSGIKRSDAQIGDLSQTYEGGPILQIQVFVIHELLRNISMSPAYIGTSGRGEVALLLSLFPYTCLRFKGE